MPWKNVLFLVAGQVAKNVGKKYRPRSDPYLIEDILLSIYQDNASL